jgi:hypothetical protein
MPQRKLLITACVSYVPKPPNNTSRLSAFPSPLLSRKKRICGACDTITRPVENKPCRQHQSITEHGLVIRAPVAVRVLDHHDGILAGRFVF